VPTHARIDRLVHWTVVASYFLAAAAFIVALVLTYQGAIWVGPLGGVSSVSVGSVAVIYAIGQYRFKDTGFPEATSAVLAVLFADAFLQVYEVLYNLTFGLASVVNDPVTVSGTEVRMLLLWGIMILPAYLVLGSLRLKRLGVAALALTAILWVVWILYGFPQYYLTSYSFHQYLLTDNSFYVSLWLNFGTKALLAVFFVSLLEPTKALRAAVRGLRNLGAASAPASKM